MILEVIDNAIYRSINDEFRQLTGLKQVKDIKTKVTKDNLHRVTCRSGTVFIACAYVCVPEEVREQLKESKIYSYRKDAKGNFHASPEYYDIRYFFVKKNRLLQIGDLHLEADSRKEKEYCIKEMKKDAIKVLEEVLHDKEDHRERS